MHPPKRVRTVHAPPPIGRGAVNRVTTVVVAEDEEVQWQWTHQPDGVRFVAGYTIVRRVNPTSPRIRPR